MLRTTLIHLLILLGPTILYVTYLIIAGRLQMSKGQAASTIRSMPWVKLLGSGLILVAASLVALSFLSGDDPGGKYVPPRIIDGEVVPAEVQ